MNWQNTKADILWQDQVSWESYTPKRRFSEFIVAGGVLKMRYSGKYVIDLIPLASRHFITRKAGECRLNSYGRQVARRSNRTAGTNF